MDGTTRDRQLAQVLVEFAHTLGTDFSIQKILDHLVLRVVDVLPVSGAGVMLMGQDDHLHFVAASNDKVLALEALQNELWEGPCLQAYATGEPVAIDDLRVDTRFARFSPRAYASGLGAVFTFPLRLDRASLGALDLYRDTPGSLDEGDMRAAQVMAEVAAAYLFNAQARLDTSVTIAQLHHRNLHDALTGLPNRTLLEERLEQAVSRGRRNHLMTAVLFIDLDGFKSVNDRHGHHIGDRLLASVARRLVAVLRPGDTLARLAGDEFVVLCEDVGHTLTATSVADRITHALTDPFQLDELELAVTASVGVAFSGQSEDIPESLLRDADVAMYEAKRLGGGRHRVSDPGARVAADHRRSLERDLQHAVAGPADDDQLQLAYQPIVAVPGRDVVGVEALLRWQHPVRGLVMPDVVVPSAERTGLILPLGEWVLERACRDFQSWRQHGDGIGYVSVNVSAHQVNGPAFAETVERILQVTGMQPENVCLEVTESVFLTDAARAQSVLSRIKSLGVRLALDDFGTGYSSLSYLHRFPFDIVKIDRSYIAALHGTPISRAIVEAIVGLSDVLDLTVLAEGVETRDQLDDVVQLGSDLAQGFYLSAPLLAGQLRGLAAMEPPRTLPIGGPGVRLEQVS